MVPPEDTRSGSRRAAPRRSVLVASRGRSDELLIAALARGMTQRDAAKAAVVSERTVRRRLTEPQFVLRVSREQKRLAREAGAGLVAMLPKAIDALGEVLDSGKPEVKLRAAQAIIDGATKYTRDAEVEAQMAILFPGIYDML
jgi:hypothetical protein